MPRMGGYKGSGGGAIRQPAFLLNGKPSNQTDTPAPASAPAPIQESVPQAVSKQARYMCGIQGCKRAFEKERHLKRHREANHEYCAKCDVAFEDSDGLLQHKIATADHIVCPMCGIDFQSESGANRHFFQMHRGKNEVSCVGCKEKFGNGAGLLKHIESGRCGQKEGQGISNGEILKFQVSRAKVNWDMQQIQQALPENSYEGTLRAAGSSIDGDESQGGVTIPTQNLLDDCDDSLTTVQPSDQTAARSMAALAASRGPTPGNLNLYQWSAMGSMRGGSVDESGTETVWGGNASRALFPNASATPAPKDWKPPDSVSLFSEREVIDPMTLEKTTVLDLELQADDMDGHYQCPFHNCSFPTVPQKDTIWQHIREHHHGFQLRCPNCSRMFKTPSALTAHLESSSMRCFARDRQGFGNVINLVSGGYLKVRGRHEDGSHLIMENIGGEGLRMLTEMGEEQW